MDFFSTKLLEQREKEFQNFYCELKYKISDYERTLTQLQENIREEEEKDCQNEKEKEKFAIVTMRPRGLSFAEGIDIESSN